MIPDIFRIKFLNTSWKEELLNKFLKEKFPTHVSNFEIWANEKNERKTINSFVKELEKVLPKVTEEVLFHYWIFQTDAFWRILKSWRNSKRIVFNEWAFPFTKLPDISEIKF